MHHLSCSLPKLIGRILFAVLFFFSGVGKLLDAHGVEQFMIAKGLPFPAFLVYASAIIEIVGAFFLLIGLYTRTTAWILFAFLALVTVAMHDFWNATEAQKGLEIISFLKNIGILAGLLYVASTGPGLWAVCRDDGCAADPHKAKRNYR